MGDLVELVAELAQAHELTGLAVMSRKMLLVFIEDLIGGTTQ